MTYSITDTLRARVEAIPDLLRECFQTPLPPIPEPLRHASSFVTTGVGASEGPARVLASALRHIGRTADFAPLSTFAPDRPLPALFSPHSVLIVVSQNLSPNATLALDLRSAFTATVLITTSKTPPAVTYCLCHPPESESGLLLRVQGPVTATLSVLRFVDALSPGALCHRDVFDAIPDAYAQGLYDTREIEPVRDQLLSLITTRGGYDFAHSLRWECLEGPGVDPPVWDVLQFAHGPFQLITDSPATLVSLEHSDDTGGSALVDRLQNLLDPVRHRLVRLYATLPGPAGYFEHAARWSRLMLATLHSRPRDLVDWPGRGRDHALYNLGR